MIIEGFRVGGLAVVAAAVGLAGAFMHQWEKPAGVFLSLAALIGVLYLSRRWLRSRLGIGIVAIAWLTPVIVFAAQRPEGDVVIQADVPGLVLIFGGAAALGIGLGMGSGPGKMRRFD